MLLIKVENKINMTDLTCVKGGLLMESNESSHDNINLVAQINLSKHVSRRILIRTKLRKSRFGQDCPICRRGRKGHAGFKII